jgi:hypothetical protein
MVEYLFTDADFMTNIEEFCITMYKDTAITLADIPVFVRGILYIYSSHSKVKLYTETKAESLITFIMHALLRHPSIELATDDTKNQILDAVETCVNIAIDGAEYTRFKWLYPTPIKAHVKLTMFKRKNPKSLDYLLNKLPSVI